MSAPAILAKYDHSAIIQRYINGERTEDLSAELGVTHQAFSHWMLRTDEESWKAAQIAKALCKRESAEQELEDAADMFAVARARERLKAAQWTLEKLFRRLFGADPAVAIQINEYTARPTEQLVDELRALLKK